VSGVRTLAALAVALRFILPSAAAAQAPVIPLSDAVRSELAALGDGVVGEPLPAAPIEDPARLRHLADGTWLYRIVAGANRGQQQTVRVERVAPGDGGATWRVVTGGDEVQQLKVTSEHEVLKLSQTDLQSDRIVVYRPGLVLDPGMRPGQSKAVESRIATSKTGHPDRVEFEGELQYTTRYLGAYRVHTPAGSFDARLLEHHYTMKIGPAKAKYRSYGFYAEDVGNVAEVSDETVSALLLYRRSNRGARVLLSAPVD